MKPIVLIDEVINIQNHLLLLSVNGNRLPLKVFTANISSYSFLAFDGLFMRDFFERLIRFCKLNGDGHFYLATSDPDPLGYYFKHFEFFGAFKFELNDLADDFVSAVNDFPIDSPADALIHRADRLDFFSSNGKWRLPGDRDAQIAVCGFADPSIGAQFQLAFSKDMLLPIELAAEFAYGKLDCNESLSLLAQYAK
jgi:hypothetical protein